MEVSANREKVYRAQLDALKEDKAKVNLLKISELGLIEMTRKRTRENLVQQLCEPCPDCGGRGYIESETTICHKILRALPKTASRISCESFELKAHPDVVRLFVEEQRESLEKVEAHIGRKVVVTADPQFHREQFEIATNR